MNLTNHLPPAAWTCREWLGRAGAGAGLLGSAARAASKPRASTRIAVVGAGLAGLTAAYRLQQAGYVVQPASGDANAPLVVEATATDAPNVTKALADASIYVSELTPIERTLEDAFLELTRSDAEPEPPA